MYALVKEGVVVKFPYSATDLIHDNPQTSWPNAPLSDEMLALHGVVPVQMPPEPDYDPIVKTLSVDQVSNKNGAWVGSWKIENSPQAANSVRYKRNQMLRESDWTQVADAPVDITAWAAYRQALRDVPAQPGFPWEVTWPQQPE